MLFRDNTREHTREIPEPERGGPVMFFSRARIRLCERRSVRLGLISDDKPLPLTRIRAGAAMGVRRN